MEAWIPITLAAAAAQTLRFMVQKRLWGTLSTAGATWARFLYSAPLVALGLVAYLSATDQGLPHPPARFWVYALSGGAAQILATACVVALFGRRHFAVGLAFKKTEVMITALAGFLILGDRLPVIGIGSIAVGMAGVVLLSDPPEGGVGPRRLMNPSAAIGLLSGLFFAISAVGYRGAVLSLEGGDTLSRAGFSLAVVTTAQSLALGLWLALREPGQVAAVLSAWRIAWQAGVLSMMGSLGWLIAFGLQTAAYVFALGQVELIFALAVGAMVFGERVSSRELAGMAVLVGSIVVLVAWG